MSNRKSYAVITGASSGIGRDFAFRLSDEGYKLILVARRADRLKKLQEEIVAIGGECQYFTADLAVIEECRILAKYLSDKKIGVFINNAGFGDCGFFEETDINKELNMIDVNIKAVHFLTKYAVKKMRKQGYGYILNVASSAGLIPAGPYMATYYATKAYVTSMTRAVARELKERGSSVYIGCLCPGPVDTEFNNVANVEFDLKGISSTYCANYAIDMMKKKRIVIIPTLKMKVAIHLGKLLPSDIYIAMCGHQQKKKLFM